MDLLKSRITIVGIFCLAIAGLEGYAMLAMRTTMDERLNAIENEYAATDERITRLMSDLTVVGKKIGVTAQELQEAQAQAIQLKQENAQLAHRLQTGLAAKADTKAVSKFQEESATKLKAVQQEATTKIDGVSGEVQVVRNDLDATRTDLKAARSDLNATRDEVASNKLELGGLIARNSTELAELRRKGERDYVEFDLKTSKEFKRIGDVLVQLKKTDVKRQKYDVVINTDDSPIQKKDRTANEPVTFLVGRDRVRYELVVNFVDKDRVRGYISAPKDKLLANELPTLRVQ
jgi:chromosome segregation ATPase